ncbi:MAG: short-chain dehydrogenase [Marinilabiliales bacterium]|nr:MAG: short-chain dehydrogenase [Marinilabiliales bacterium]
MTNYKVKYGPWAIVAGASEGLGAAFAEELAKRGLNLILIARGREKLELLANKLKNKYSVIVDCYSADLSDYQNIKSIIPIENLEIGLLVYNAAYAPISYFKDISEDDLDKIVNVNIKTPLLLTKLLSDRMMHRGRGGIILMSSLAGTQGSPKISTYAASKAFNIILAEGLWSELKQKGIDVLASAAGAIRTPGYENAQSEKDAPGTLDANKVAKDTLNALGKGPITVPGLTNKMVRFLMGRILPRKLAIKIMHNNTKNLS